MCVCVWMGLCDFYFKVLWLVDKNRNALYKYSPLTICQHSVKPYSASDWLLFVVWSQLGSDGLFTEMFTHKHGGKSSQIYSPNRKSTSIWRFTSVKLGPRYYKTRNICSSFSFFVEVKSAIHPPSPQQKNHELFIRHDLCRTLSLAIQKFGLLHVVCQILAALL